MSQPSGTLHALIRCEKVGFMSHVSLYRRHRPMVFDDVVGQDHITRTLRNAVREGSLASGYLFTGPRGTGKTTTARILAKALICTEGPKGDPDGTCAQCEEIAEGRHPDVLELDAASRRGIDAVREEIIRGAQYSPVRGRAKVYIIDEVHMLTKEAFNAFLKTLEEPPPGVVFVLCTTDPHKVPETIHSRCQRFDFRRIGIQEIADRLESICAAEGIKSGQGALELLARHADGGMRDAITTLEQVAAFTENDFSVDDVESMLGEVSIAQLFEVGALAARRDVPGCFRFVAQLVETGADIAGFVGELTSHVRDLYVVSLFGDVTGIVDAPPEQISRLRAQALEFEGPDRLARALAVLETLASDLRYASDPRLALEVAFVRLAHARGDLTLEALSERIESLEVGGVSHPVRPAAQAPATPSPVVPAEEGAEPVLEDSRPAPRQESHSPQEQVTVIEASSDMVLDLARVKRSWPAVVAEIRKRKRARAPIFESAEANVDADGVTLVIEIAGGSAFALTHIDDPEMRGIVQSALAIVFGQPVPFRYQVGRGAVKPIPPAKQAQRVDVPPATAGDETSSTPAPKTGGGIDQSILQKIGGQVVGERVPETAHSMDEGDDD